MAIVWGSWVAGNRWRVGVDLSYSGTPSSGSVTVKADIWFQVRYASSESGQPGTRWGVSGDIGTAANQFDWSLGSMGTKKLGTKSAVVALNYGTTKKVTVNGSAHVDYTYPGDGSISASLTLPARPYDSPAAPSGVSLARGSGESLTVSWTRNATTGAPYSSQTVQVLHSKTSTWATVATVSGTATSFQFSGTTDRKYQVRVRSQNSAGQSAYAYSSSVSTTPAAPATPAAGKNAAGDVIVSYAAPASGSSASQYEIWHAANGVWDGAPLTTVAAAAGSYQHPTPDKTKTHAYRLRAVSSSPTLFSAYSGTSQTVQLQAPPNAPTNLAPSGESLDATVDRAFIWKHNPVDSTPQTAYEFAYRVDGGAWVYSGKIVTDIQFHVVTGGTWANGHTVEWMVRTWGAATSGGTDGAGASLWSLIATVTTSAAPTVAINSPDEVTPVDTSRLTVTWGYYQEQGSPQAQWRAILYDGGGARLQVLSGSDAATSATFTKPILDGRPYAVDVAVRSAAGLWSNLDVVLFTVDYPEPPRPEVTAYWRPDEGAVVLDVFTPGPAEGLPEAVSVDVFRAIERDEWRLIAQNVEPGASVTDYIPPLSALVTYKAVAVSALPSMQESAPVEVLTEGADRIFLNAGPGFSQTIRFAVSTKVSISPARAKGTWGFAGRDYSVPWWGQGRARTITINTTLYADWVYTRRGHETSTWEEIEDLADLDTVACYRDPSGRRHFVQIGDPGIDGLFHDPTHPVTIGLEQVDWTEPVGSET